MMHSGGYTVDSRIRWPEWLPWIAALAAFFLLPEYLSLGARILIYILFALSLDLILGYAGIITLGHSAFYAIGAYTAAIMMNADIAYYWTLPVAGLKAGLGRAKVKMPGRKAGG